ncbi:hypothetical protein CHS0354_023116 [Potamilus streckersoni]|uniref:Uncharacterized protein n=1 Tax=Potamilus streckersoni TaxID=2493646 RepID=A0AAE0VFS3_9BIVA|nr:hypothetical protein CHS0354_023116 [Potamilus streckersoni]
MRTFTFLLLVSVVCAVAFTKDLRKRSSYMGDDVAPLDVLVKTIMDGNIELDDFHRLLKDDTNNHKRYYAWRW